MADVLPKDTSELLAQIEREWHDLMRTIDRLTPQQMTTPDSGGWSPKDNLAHLAEWMRYMHNSFLHKMPAYEAMGIQADKFKQLDEAGINAVLFERNRGRTADDVLTDLKTIYASVVETLRTTPFSNLMKPLRMGGASQPPALEFVLGNTSDHFREHRQTIEKVS